MTGKICTTQRPADAARSTSVAKSPKSPAPRESHERREKTGVAIPAPRHAWGNRKCPSRFTTRTGAWGRGLRARALGAIRGAAAESEASSSSSETRTPAASSGNPPPRSNAPPKPPSPGTPSASFSRALSPPLAPSDASRSSSSHPRGATTRSGPVSKTSFRPLGPPSSAYLYRAGRSSWGISTSARHTLESGSRIIASASPRSQFPSASHPPVTRRRCPGNRRSVRHSSRTRVVPGVGPPGGDSRGPAGRRPSAAAFKSFKARRATSDSSGGPSSSPAGRRFVASGSSVQGPRTTSRKAARQKRFSGWDMNSHVSWISTRGGREGC